VHQRRQSDVETWILSGVMTGTVRRGVDVRRVVEQFCAAIVGIVCQWLGSPLVSAPVRQFHAGLERAMRGVLSFDTARTAGVRRGAT
jgi:hypothetical protein